MKILKYLAGIWIALAIYTIFSFLGGARGMSSYNYLLSERDQQRENIRELGLLNEELEMTRNNLLFDEDTILVHAREMGYGYDGDRFIRIVGLGNTKHVPAVPGSIYTTQKPDFIPDRYIKIAAFCVGLLVFAFLLTLEIIEKRSK